MLAPHAGTTHHLDSANAIVLRERLLPNEPRIRNFAMEDALTIRHLQPVLRELEACMLAVRTQLDPELQRLRPAKERKPYPIGQCLEIAKAVRKRLVAVDAATLPANAAVGLRALRAFQRAGGSFRLVWGDLRGQYFQNAFQLGTLYVDVSNDTVVPTKPKVEILPFEDAQFIPIRDFWHYSEIASRYWTENIYPNHVLPKLAPHCPLLHISNSGQIRVFDASDYMVSLTKIDGFKPSESVLGSTAMPVDVFDRVAHALKGSGHLLAPNAEHGRLMAMIKQLLFCKFPESGFGPL